MERTHGTWGERIVTWSDNASLVAILTLYPHKRCSWHKHAHSYNQFYVIEGELVVKTDIGPNNQRNVAIITKGQSFLVSPGVMHEFRTREKQTIVEEIAFVKYDSRDIHREQLGGDCQDALNVHETIPDEVSDYEKMNSFLRNRNPSEKSEDWQERERKEKGECKCQST